MPTVTKQPDGSTIVPVDPGDYPEKPPLASALPQGADPGEILGVDAEGDPTWVSPEEGSHPDKAAHVTAGLADGTVLDDHIDPLSVDSHPASAITIEPVGVLVSTTQQDFNEELYDGFAIQVTEINGTLADHGGRLTDVEAAATAAQGDADTAQTGATAAQATADAAAAAIVAHVNDADDAHDASAVSFSNTGLIVLTGITNVQAALARLDEAARPRSGTIETRPLVTDVPEGARYLATNVDGGAEYQKIAGAWVQTGAAVDAGSGQHLKRVGIATTQAITAAAGVTDVVGGTFDANVPQVNYPVEIWLHVEGAIKTVGTVSLLTVTAGIYLPDNTLVRSRSGYVPTWRPPAATFTAPSHGAAAADAGATETYTAWTTHLVPNVPDVFAYRAAGAAAQNYKIRITVLGTGYEWWLLGDDSALGTSWMVAIGR